MTIVYLIVVVIMVFLMIFALDSDGPGINTIIIISFSIVPLIIMCILVYRIRAFGDNFYIVQEIKWLVIITLIASIAYTLLNAQMNIFMRSFCANLISMFKSVVGVYVQTMYTLKIIRTDQEQSGDKIAAGNVEMISSRDITHSAEISKSKVDADTKTSTNSITTTIRTKTSTQPSFSNTKTNQISMSLTDSLRESDKFENFMLHLSRDFSMEILLSFIELTQLQKVIKQYLYENDGKMEMEFSPTQEAFLENTDIPKSYIVYHTNIQDVMRCYGITLRQEYNLDDRMVDLKLRACAFFWKYIA